MTINKDFFQPDRDANYDFQRVGQSPVGWEQADRLPETLIPTHCCFCGVQCGMYLRVADGQVIATFQSSMSIRFRMW